MDRLTRIERLYHLLAAVVIANCVHTVWVQLAAWSTPLGNTRLEFHRDTGGSNAPVVSTGFLRIQSALADGNLERWRNTGNYSGWKIGHFDSALAPYLEYSPAAPEVQRAVVDFPNTRNLVMTIESRDWDGYVRVIRNGNATGALYPIRREGGAIIRTAIADPPKEQVYVGPWWVAFLGWIVAVIVVAPTLSGQSRLVTWLLLPLSLYHFVYWLCQPPGYHGDSTAYVGGVGTFLMGSPGLQPPGYSMFIGLAAILGPSKIPWAVPLLQHAMAVVSVLWLFRMLRRCVHPNLAFAASLVAGFSMPLMATAQTVLSEMPTCFALVGALYFSIEASAARSDLLSSEDRRHTRLAVLAGVMAGWAGLLRGVPLAGAVPGMMLVFLLMGPRPLRLRKLGIAIGALTFTLLVPLSWFAVHGNGLKIATSSGFHLLNRVALEQKLLAENGPATRQLRELLPGVDLRQTWAWQWTGHPGVKNMDVAVLEGLARRAALEGISSDPQAYLSHSIKIAKRTYLTPTDWIPYWANTPEPFEWLERPPLLPFTGSSLRWLWDQEEMNRYVWQVATVLLLAGLPGLILFWRKHQEPQVLAAMAATIFLYLLATAFMATYAPRYNAPLASLIFGLAVVPIDQCGRLAVTIRKRLHLRKSSEHPVILET
jgi:hypothetical protein